MDKRFAARKLYLVIAGAFLSNAVDAACITVGTATTCDSNGIQTTTVGHGPLAPSAASVTVEANAQISTIEASAISLGNDAIITISSGAIVQTNATSNIGLYATGANTVEFDSSGQLTIEQGAHVLATGTEIKGEAINVQGVGNIIVNAGEVRSEHAAAIWFESAPGNNVVVNDVTGVIATGVADGNVIGSSDASAVDFINKGTVIGNLEFSDGDDILRLHTGSSISGTISGGGGNNLLTLGGSGLATLSSAVSDFQTMVKQGGGTWVVNGLPTGLSIANVDQGTLAIGDSNHAGHAVTATFNVASGGVLGGYGRIDGNVDNSGTIAVANAVGAFSGNGNGNFTVNGTLNNAGLLQIGGGGVGNTLTVFGGGYVGQNGAAALNATLDGDGSVSDRIVLDGVSASGSTVLTIRNVGGTGAATTGNGILVVDAINGGSTTATAFFLGDSVKAGAYSYRLFKGGATADSSENWYLRSSVLSIDGTGTVTEIPLYRTEVALYSAVPGVARLLGVRQLDAFHARQGDQWSLTGDSEQKSSWGRAWGESVSFRRDGSVRPGFDGKSAGFQVGTDLHTDRLASGTGNHVGVFFSYGRTEGRVKGDAEGRENVAAGRLTTDSYGIGGYWTHVGGGGWYTDAVVTGNYLAVGTRSDSSVGASTDGYALLASVEGGFPVALSQNLSIEPQAQLVWQHLRINNINDTAGNARFDLYDSATGRFGVRVQGSHENSFAVWRPYVQVDVLRTFDRADNLVFDQSAVISTSGNRTVSQVGAGFVAAIGKSGSVYAKIVRSFDLTGDDYATLSANIGGRWVW